MSYVEEHRMLTEAQARYWNDEARQRGKRGELLELLLNGQWHPNHDAPRSPVLPQRDLRATT